MVQLILPASRTMYLIVPFQVTLQRSGVKYQQYSNYDALYICRYLPTIWSISISVLWIWLCCTASFCINFPDFKFTIELSFKGHLLPRIRE